VVRKKKKREKKKFHHRGERSPWVRAGRRRLPHLSTYCTPLPGKATCSWSAAPCAILFLAHRRRPLPVFKEKKKNGGEKETAFSWGSQAFLFWRAFPRAYASELGWRWWLSSWEGGGREKRLYTNYGKVSRSPVGSSALVGWPSTPPCRSSTPEGRGEKGPLSWRRATHGAIVLSGF